MSKEHKLKTWPEYFQAVKTGAKTFEVRENDRFFAVGDTLILNEFDGDHGRYTGESLKLTVTYVLLGGAFGIKKQYCVMGFKPDKTE